MKDEDLTGGQWWSTGSWWPGKKFSCQSGLYLTLFFFFFFFRKIEAKQNKSHRMQNTSTSRSTDFRRQMTITSKRHWLCMGEVSVLVTEPRRWRPVRWPGPSQIKMYGSCRLFTLWLRRTLLEEHGKEIQQFSLSTVSCPFGCLHTRVGAKHVPVNLQYSTGFVLP